MSTIDADIARFVKFLDATEGRDKITKCVQYACRGLSWGLAEQNKELAERLRALYATASDSRKIFRIGKFINEYIRLKQISKTLKIQNVTTTATAPNDHDICLSSQPSFSNQKTMISSAINVGRFLLGLSPVQMKGVTPDGVEDRERTQKDGKCYGTLDIERLLLFVSRSGFLCYWIFDSLSILSKIKALKYDTNGITKRAGGSWFVALMFGLLYELYRIKKSYKKEDSLSKRLSLQYKCISSPSANNVVTSTTPSSRPINASDDNESKLRRNSDESPPLLSPSSVTEDMDICEIEKLLLKESKNRNTYYVNVAKCCGDLIAASNLVGISERVLGRPFNDGIVGLGGLTSAVLSCTQVYPKK